MIAHHHWFVSDGIESGLLSCGDIVSIDNKVGDLYGGIPLACIHGCRVEPSDTPHSTEE